MPGTTLEERMAAIETRTEMMMVAFREMKEEQSRALYDLKSSVDSLTTYAHMGKGVLWFCVKGGVWLAAVVGLTKLLYDTIHPILPK